MNDPNNRAMGMPGEYDEVFGSVVREMNREHNFEYLGQMLQGAQLTIVRNQETGYRSVYIPSLGISFDHDIVHEFPLRFRAFVDALVIRIQENRSRLHNQPKVVKPVSMEHGRQYYITPKLLEGKKCEKNCSICLDPLLPEGKRRKKVWELECGDSFCVGCIRKWFKMDSRCPNCRKDCSLES